MISIKFEVDGEEKGEIALDEATTAGEDEEEIVTRFIRGYHEIDC